jgi:hypothetical protein
VLRRRENDSKNNGFFFSARVLLASRQWWVAGACGVCAVAFGLEAAGVETLGRTRRVLVRLRER